METLLQKIKKMIPSAKDVRPAEAVIVDGQIIVTAQFLCDYFGVGRRSISLWQKRGLEAEVSRSGLVATFDLSKAIKWHKETISEKHSAWGRGEKPEGSDGPLPKIDHENVDLSTASIETLDRLKAIEDVKKKRTENARALGDLVPAEDLDRAMAEQAVMHRANYEEDLELLPTALEHKTKTEIADFLDKHYARRMEHTHTFITTVFDAPNWLYRKIQELINEHS